MDTPCPKCHHADAHRGGGIGVCRHVDCGCDNTTNTTAVKSAVESPAVWQGDAGHDPLCYMAQGKWDGGCQCALIARVRADQRECCVAVVEEVTSREGSPDLESFIAAILEKS